MFFYIQSQGYKKRASHLSWEFFFKKKKPNYLSDSFLEYLSNLISLLTCYKSNNQSLIISFFPVIVSFQQPLSIVRNTNNSDFFLNPQDFFEKKIT